VVRLRHGRTSSTNRRTCLLHQSPIEPIWHSKRPNSRNNIYSFRFIIMCLLLKNMDRCEWIKLKRCCPSINGPRSDYRRIERWVDGENLEQIHSNCSCIRRCLYRSPLHFRRLHGSNWIRNRYSSCSDNYLSILRIDCKGKRKRSRSFHILRLYLNQK